MAGFEIVTDADAAFVAACAAAMDDLGQETVSIIYGLAPHKSNRYRRSLGSTTYAGNALVAGKALRNRARIGKADIQTVVYTSSSLGLLLEAGTKRHDIPIQMEHGPMALKIVKHPGSRRFRHFGPGALAAVSRIPSVIAAGIARRVR
jgi:hypothetical protein